MTLRNALALIVTLWLLTACAGFTADESASLSQQDDPEALKIKAALLEEPNLAGSAIDVAFEDGRVRLTGFVETREQSQLAESIAQQQEAVTEVVNDIVVK